MSMAYPPRLPLAQLPTPLQHLPRVSAEFGRGQRIWVKRDDLSDTALSGNKLRKLEFVLARARELGCNTLITCGGVQSNHCRATALVGARLGMTVHLLLRGEPPADVDGNLLFSHLAGAHINYYSAAQFAGELPQLVEHWQEHYRQQGERAFFIPVGASDGLGVWGYVAAAEELGADMREAGLGPAHWVSATGSGGTQAGLTLGAQLHHLPARVWGVNVCDDAAWFIDKVNADVLDWQQRYRPLEPVPQLEVRVLDGYAAPGYGEALPEVYQMIATVARLEGLILDPCYTGKAFLGMLRELEQGRFEDREDIVFIHTGGIFGLFPQRRHFRFAD